MEDERLTDIIYWLVVQHLADQNWYVDSKHITADADAIRYLVEKGLVELEHDGGGRVISGYVENIFDKPKLRKLMTAPDPFVD